MDHHHTAPAVSRANGSPPEQLTGDWARWALITIDTLADPRARLSHRLRAAEQLQLVAQVAGASGELAVTIHSAGGATIRRRNGGRGQ